MRSVCVNRNKKSVRLLYRFTVSHLCGADVLLCAVGEKRYLSDKYVICVS